MNKFTMRPRHKARWHQPAGAAGFSILEATVVLAMISIVAATAGSHIGEFLSTARTIKAKGDVRVLVTSMTQFLNDVGRLRGVGGGPPPSLLVTDGDEPEAEGADAIPWTLPPDGRQVHDLYAHLVENSAGYRMNPDEGNRWRGPYVEGLGSDPWGFRYAVNVGCLTAAGTSYITIAVSAGPDGVVAAPFRTRVLLTRNIDDVLGIVSTGKDDGAAPEDQTRSPVQDPSSATATNNLCAGTGPQRNR